MGRLQHVLRAVQVDAHAVQGVVDDHVDADGSGEVEYAVGPGHHLLDEPRVEHRALDEGQAGVLPDGGEYRPGFPSIGRREP